MAKRSDSAGTHQALASAQALDERAQRLLKMLVEAYIDDGAPVASRRLANQPGMKVSSATVRNVMGELEAKGLVASPHTSAGKVPTQAGFRFFVDTLVSLQPLDARDIEHVQTGLDPDLTTSDLVASASALLSDLTHMAGVVTIPRREVESLRQVEFLPLSGNRILTILVVNEREVQNRIVHVERDYSEIELTQIANFINREFAGKPLSAVRAGIVESMQLDKKQLDQHLESALDLVSQTFVEAGREEAGQVVVAGETNLISMADEADVDAVKQLFEAFYRKREIVRLLDQCLDSQGIQLFIGNEAGREFLEEVSVVTAPYAIDGQVAGVLGVIGPTRMAYQRIIPLVDVTARMLGAALAPVRPAS